MSEYTKPHELPECKDCRLETCEGRHCCHVMKHKEDRLQALADLVPELLEILEIAMGKMCGSCSRVADSKGNHPCDVCEHIEWNKTIEEAKEALK